MTEKNILVAYFFCTVLVAHVLLPTFNDGEDFFLFYAWNMFSFNSDRKVTDISCPTDDQSLFRDKNQAAKEAKIDLVSLLHHIDFDLKNINQLQIEKIKKFCDTKNIKILKFKENYFEYFILMKRTQALEKISI